MLRILFNMVRDCLWSRGNSVWDGFNLITGSSWHLSQSEFRRWLATNQRGELRLELVSVVKQTTLILWLVYNVLRLAFYLIMLPYYSGNYRSGKILQPPFPVYFGCVLQYLHSFLFYALSACLTFTCYLLVTTYQLRLSRFGANPSIGWFRIFLYVHAMQKLKFRQARKHFRLLRLLTLSQYRRYAKRFRLVQHVQRAGFSVANFTTLLTYCLVMCIVLQNPEWNVSLWALAVSQFFMALWFNCIAKITFSLLIIFYLNTSLVRGFFDTYEDWIWRKSKNTERKFGIFLNEVLRLLNDINRLWAHPLGNYFFFFLPAIMICLYLMLFQRLNPFHYVILSYVVTTLGFSMHFNIWTASHVRTSSKRIYRKLYHRGHLLKPSVNILARYHVIIICIFLIILIYIILG